MPANTHAQPQLPLSHAEVDRRIASLRRHLIPPRCTRENLTRPLHKAIRVDHTPGHHKLVLVAAGVDVSWTTVVDFDQQIGGGIIRMGGIAEVGTHDKHRFRGYSRCVLENSLRWMKQNDYHTTMLYGIPSYYPKFGYAKAFPHVLFTVAVRDAECADPGGTTFVPFEVRRHARVVLRMYQATNRGRSGVTRRDPAVWQGFRKGLSWNAGTIAEVAVTAKGKPLGYIVFNDQHLSASVIEIGFSTAKVFPALLHRAARFAWRQRRENIEFHLPEDDAFMGYCRRYGVRLQTRCSRDGGAMVRIIDGPAALRAVTAELGSRMQTSGALNLKTNLDTLSLSWQPDSVTVGGETDGIPTVRLPQWALAQMLYGYQSCPALTTEGWVKGPRAALEALDEMFPVRPHYQYAGDHF